MSSLRGQLILSLYPGADLFSRPFEALGACVVRGPERMLGQDIRTWHGLPGRFDGIIGGPPCARFSTARHGDGDPWDGIPDFLRVARECEPKWWVMENVRGALGHPNLPASGAIPCIVRHWDLGGLTKRIRVFWFWPPELGLFARMRVPAKRPGWSRAAYSVTASCGARPQNRGHSMLKAREAARLQGFPELCRFPNRAHHYLSNEVAVWLLGNGVPREMGEWCARIVAEWLARRQDGDVRQLVEKVRRQP